MKTKRPQTSLVMQMVSGFHVSEDCLEIGGMPLTRLAQRVGQTPFFAYSRARIDERVSLLRRHIPSRVSIHYAIKANPFTPLVHHLAGKVEGFDVASATEMALALDTGVAPADISFAGPGKRDEELARAIAAQVLLNVESPRELMRVHALAKQNGLNARVSLRINPSYNLNSSGMKMGGGPKQFGMDAAQIPDMLALLRKFRWTLAFEGFQIYPGSQNLRVDYLIDAQNKALELVVELASHAPAPVRRFNLGGGFGVPYFQGDQELDIAAIGHAMHDLVSRVESVLPQVEIILELGRYLVASAGIYVAKIIDRKISHDKVFLVADGGMNHHLAASGNLGQLIRRNYPVVIGNRIQGLCREQVNVVGPLCTPLDILAHQVELAESVPGDLVVVFQSGAYGLSASPYGFLNQPMAAEVMV